MFKIDEILKSTNGELIKVVNTKFDKIEVDTREIVPNTFFIATKGRSVDTHDLIDEALQKGATGIMFSDNDKYNEYCKKNRKELTAVKIKSNKIYDSFGIISKKYLEKYNCEVIRITGTAGKSTTTKLIRHLLSHKFNVVSTGDHYSGVAEVGRAVLKIGEHSDYAIIELSMAPYDLTLQGKTLSMVESKSKVGIITNISNSHACIEGGVEEIFNQKSRIVTCLNEDSIGILNADDSSTAEIIKLSKCKIMTFGINNPADIMAKDIEVKRFSTEFKIVSKDKVIYVDVPILGMHNVYNVLAAVACVVNKGILLEEISEYIKTFESVKMRMESIFLKNGVRLINDTYNSSQISMEGAIDTLSKIQGERKIAVVGDITELGDLTKKVHLDIANYMEGKMPDILITYGDSSELISKYLASKGKMCYHCQSKREVIDILMEKMLEGDVILFKGSRVMKLEEIIRSLL